MKARQIKAGRKLRLSKPGESKDDRHPEVGRDAPYGSIISSTFPTGEFAQCAQKVSLETNEPVLRKSS